ncbi:MarR family winged helix-turn-helix transcriptional regulator [Actinomycetospora sp. CA-101289]|uniref:MarR family winged helix-turn-helix transcriptional regulator n=1 Tax=Actinomycetospora sp. CA-101289 TaxID=3239893 RepID=UPI003D96A8DF
MDRDEVEAELDAATDELVRLLLDDLGPTLQWYRDEVARRLGLSHAELLCLELCRRHGAVTSNRIGTRLGLTRSAAAKLVRRLEAAGHVTRRHGQADPEVEVRLRPHAARDAVLADLRGRMWRAVRGVVANHGLRERRHALVATALVGISNVVFAHAQALADAAADKRLHAARRRAREADTSAPWWR